LLVYLDSNIVIYLIEQPALWGPRARSRVAALRSNHDEIVASDLTRMECRIRPTATGDAQGLALFDSFFSSSDVRVVGLTPSVCDRATIIRATHGLKPMDALHVAAAVENRCDLFITNDTRLSGFPDIKVEVLP
jgi:predicted nucleic acid-binding protein